MLHFYDLDQVGATSVIMLRLKFSLLVIILIFTFESNLFCQEKSKQEELFKEFWTLFDENYASFKEKNVNWQESYDLYYPKVTDQTTDAELYTIFCEMIKVLNDGHVTLVNANDERFSASRPSRILKEFSKTDSPKKAKYYEMIAHTLAANDFGPIKEVGPKFKGKSLFYYASNENYGYLRFDRSFATMVNMKGFSTQRHLETIFAEFKDKEGLIVDIRFNIGGDDSFSYEVAGRFTDKTFLGHYKQIKNRKGHDEFTELDSFYVQPAGEAKFLKPVMLLTNDRTVSAADVFALVMSELPQVTIIGENSNGSFSDLMAEKLSNGWKVTLSNQRYLSTDKTNYEGIGVPVDIEVLTLLSDLEKMSDTVLTRALNELDEKKADAPSP